MNFSDQVPRILPYHTAGQPVRCAVLGAHTILGTRGVAEYICDILQTVGAAKAKEHEFKNFFGTIKALLRTKWVDEEVLPVLLYRLAHRRVRDLS